MREGGSGRSIRPWNFSGPRKVFLTRSNMTLTVWNFSSRVRGVRNGRNRWEECYETR